jgi:hypothetical protein
VSLDSAIRDCNFERTISERLSENGFCDSVKGIGGNDENDCEREMASSREDAGLEREVLVRFAV